MSYSCLNYRTDYYCYAFQLDALIVSDNDSIRINNHRMEVSKLKIIKISQLEHYAYHIRGPK